MESIDIKREIAKVELELEMKARALSGEMEALKMEMEAAKEALKMEFSPFVALFFIDEARARLEALEALQEKALEKMEEVESFHLSASPPLPFSLLLLLSTKKEELKAALKSWSAGKRALLQMKAMERDLEEERLELKAKEEIARAGRRAAKEELEAATKEMKSAISSARAPFAFALAEERLERALEAAKNEAEEALEARLKMKELERDLLKARALQPLLSAVAFFSEKRDLEMELERAKVEMEKLERAMEALKESAGALSRSPLSSPALTDHFHVMEEARRSFSFFQRWSAAMKEELEALERGESKIWS